jgi:DNA-binding CsgD family transcriptional regulator
MTELEKFQKRYTDLLDTQEFNVKELDYSILEKHIPFFNHLDSISGSSVAVFDLYQRKVVYLSSKFESVHGYDLNAIYKGGKLYDVSYMHPDDVLELSKAGYYFYKVISNMPAEEIKEFKGLLEYRFKSKNEYVRVIEQSLVLETDKRGNIWLALSIMDLAPINDLESPAKFRLMNHKSGELYAFPPIEEIGLDNLTSREQEVLKLLSRGLISKQIADSLYISVHTVNTHRQRILEKLNAGNTAEAIKFARELGLLS